MKNRRTIGSIAAACALAGVAQARLYAEFQPLAAWKSRLQATCFGETDEFDEAQQPRGLRNTGNVFLVDFTTGHDLGPGRISLRISKLFNRKYANATNQASGDTVYYLSEGRRATLTYQARF